MVWAGVPVIGTVQLCVIFAQNGELPHPRMAVFS